MWYSGFLWKKKIKLSLQIGIFWQGLCAVCFNHFVICSKRELQWTWNSTPACFIFSQCLMSVIHIESALKIFFSLWEKIASFALLIRQLLHLVLLTGFARQSGEKLGCRVSFLLNFERCVYFCWCFLKILGLQVEGFKQ